MLLIGTASAQQDDGEFTYQGRIRVTGQAVNGSVSLYLALLTKAEGHEEVLWTNDEAINGGTTTPGFPFDMAYPVAAVVDNGLFSVSMGDADSPNMAPISPAVWNAGEQVFLRVWVKLPDRPIEQLEPDAPLSVGSLLGGSTRRALDLFVDPTAGNDRWPGHKPHRPKRTIASALKALPPLLRHPATIHLADGVYFEEVWIENVALTGRGTTLSLMGNVSDPSTVIITGAMDEATSSTASRQYGVVAREQAGLFLKGLTVERTTTNAIYTVGRGSVRMENCIVRNNEGQAVYAAAADTSVVDSVITDNFGGLQYIGGGTVINATITNNAQWGVLLQNTAYARLINVTIRDCPRFGIYLILNSACRVSDSLIENCGSLREGEFAVVAERGSSITFDGTTIKNSPVGGVQARSGGVAYFAGLVSTISGCPVGARASSLGLVQNKAGHFLNFADNVANTQTSEGGIYSVADE